VEDRLALSRDEGQVIDFVHGEPFGKPQGRPVEPHSKPALSAFPLLPWCNKTTVFCRADGKNNSFACRRHPSLDNRPRPTYALWGEHKSVQDSSAEL
jgi:hypothetical protein